MLRLRARWNSVTSSASPLDRAKVRSSKRRVLTSATKSPGCGSSDHDLAAQIAEIEIERLRHALVEHAQAAAEGAAVERDRLEHAVGHALLEFKGIEAHERGR